jgi:5-methylcytosine-specific restriction endonuclease McrA
MLKQKSCQQCKISFTPRNDSPGIFCSKSCNAKYHNSRRIHKPKISDRKCLQCNADIFKPNKFCNSSCAATFNNKLHPKKSAKIHNCPCCGTETKTNHGKYCSNACYQAGRPKKYTPEQAVLRRKQLNREVAANYRARVKNQTPADVDRKAIQEFYANCPIGYEVDHITPISKGGLHDLSNLQYLTIQENRKKSNKIL